MQAIVKPAIVLGIAAALALGSMTPSQARVRPWVAAGVGLAAGAALASAANANAYHNGYGPGYYYGPGYAGYAYSPYYESSPGYGAYAYAPPSAPETRFQQPYHGPDTNYIGSWRERQLEGRDY